MRKIQIVFIAALAVLLVNCSSVPKVEESAVEPMAEISSSNEITEQKTTEYNYEDDFEDSDEEFSNNVMAANNDIMAEEIIGEVAEADAILVEKELVQSASLVGSDETKLYEVVQLELDRPKVEPRSNFRQGFKRFSKDCNMRSRGSSRSQVLGQIPKGRRLWVENHSGSWAKVYRRNGPAYVYKGCL